MKVWFANFLSNRIDRLLSTVPVAAMIKAEVDKQVEAKLSKIDIESLVRSVADETIRDDCDVESVLSNHLDSVDLGDHINYEQFAAEIDYRDLAGYVDYTDLAGSIDADDLGRAVRSGATFEITVKEQY